MTDDPAHRGRQRAMRLGTRSCAECRRRKIRCVYPVGSRICEGCSLRRCPCLAQQQGQQRLSAQRIRERGVVNEGLQQRVQALEKAILRTCRGLDLHSDVEKNPNVKVSVVRALRHLQLRRAEDTDSSTGGTPSYGDSSTLYSTDDSDDGLDFKDAPLAALFKAAAMLDDDASSESCEALDLSSSSRLRHLSSVFDTIMLKDEYLDSILKTTQKYWKLWPTCYYGPRTSDTIRCNEAPPAAAGILSGMLRSGDPSVMAKAILFLSLCIQQLPRTWPSQGLPSAPQVLVTSYMRTADDLIYIVTGIRETIDAAEAWIFESTLYINMGKPRKAWLCFRRAANAALLLGLHRVANEGRSEREDALWTQIWQGERFCSLTLGLPSAISNQHPAMTRSLTSNDGVYGPLQHRLYILAGEIIERNQSSPFNYVTTMQIDQEVEQCKTLMPNDFWSEPPCPDWSLIDIYYRQVTKIQYFICIMMLHMPFMLKSSAERKFEYNRVAGQDASREIIKNFLLLRKVPNAELIICEVLDFHVFSAGMILMINLLSHPDLASSDDTNRDLALVKTLAETFQQTASLMHCNVARQGSHLLDLLMQVQRGSYRGRDKFVAILPYFGKVKISFPINGLAGPLSEEVNQSTALPDTTGSVEFSSWSSDQDFLMTMGFEQELCGDWSAVPDMDANINYDWSQTFLGDQL
ncbi:hypothetical protein F5Y19DRAFT_411101 [Xylariaceae sp. FL1651]|nr:hypothetical protein F5Y19DRAFT_411101 [Xylariaceae sp. FL1651]